MKKIGFVIIVIWLFMLSALLVAVFMALVIDKSWFTDMPDKTRAYYEGVNSCGGVDKIILNDDLRFGMGIYICSKYLEYRNNK